MGSHCPHTVTGCVLRLTVWNLFLVGIVNLFCILTGAWIIVQFVAFRKEEPSMCAVSNSFLQHNAAQCNTTQLQFVPIRCYRTDIVIFGVILTLARISSCWSLWWKLQLSAQRLLCTVQMWASMLTWILCVNWWNKCYFHCTMGVLHCLYGCFCVSDDRTDADFTPPTCMFHCLHGNCLFQMIVQMLFSSCPCVCSTACMDIVCFRR